jgi:hypothetical protein
MPTVKKESIADPVNAQVGGDADINGIAQTLTSDDIQAVLMSPAPVEERLEALKNMRGELEARSHADFGGDIAPLVSEIDGALRQLSQDGFTADPTIDPNLT